MKKHNRQSYSSRQNKSPQQEGGPPAAPPFQQAGFTLLELLICLALAAVIILGLNSIIGTSLDARRIVQAENNLALQAEFALDRIHRMVHQKVRLILPMNENSATAWSESVRDVLAVTLPSNIDLDENGWPDADNDQDGLIDEDLPNDNNFDGAPGIAGIDDNGDGTADNSSAASPVFDNDEDGLFSDDFLDGMDNDNDGTVDEDMPSDMNKDGRAGISGIDDDNDGLTDEGVSVDDDEDSSNNEDWYDIIVYYLAGTTLMERLPVPWDENSDSQVDGRDYVENPLAENVTRFEVTRQEVSGGRKVLVLISLELTGAGGQSYSLATVLRLGGGA